MSKFSAGSPHRNVLDIKRAASSRAKAQRQMTPLLQRPVRLKTRRRRKQILMFCICILCAAGVVGGLGAASHYEKFAIKDVSVTGADRIAPESLTAAVHSALQETGFHLFSRTNMFLYPKSLIESDLSKEFPRIKAVSVARQSLLASAVVVSVKERDAFALWCPSTIAAASHGAGDSSEKCFVMDAGGFIYADAGDSPSTAYIFHGGLLPNTETIGQTFLRGRMQDALSLLDALAKAGFKPQGLSVDSEKDFSVRLDGGPLILASFDMRIDDIIRNLQTALDADGMKDKFVSLEYIDLRFGNRVYYK